MRGRLCGTVTILGACTALLVSGAANAAKRTYVGQMNGAQVVPPVVTAGKGTATLTFDDTALTLCGKITYADLSGPARAAHVHDRAGARELIATMPMEPTPMNVNVSLTAQEAARLANPFYVSIHTDQYIDGEIRGDMEPADGGVLEQACEGVDAGTDAAAVTVDAGSDAGTPQVDAGAKPSTSPPADDGGCSASSKPPSVPSTGFALAFCAGLASVAIRWRRRRKRS